MSDQNLSLAPGSHVSLLYENEDEQKEAILPFIKEGLENGEQCYYVADEQPVDDWFFEFQAYGIDVESERQKGSLIVCSGEAWRRPAAFSSTQNAREALGMIERGLAAFSGVRFAVDLGWTLEPPMPHDVVCHWEATLNIVIDEDVNVRVLCQYNIGRQSEPAVHSALRTHPIVLVGGLLRPNPYYEALRILENEPHLNHSNADAGMIEGMLIALADQQRLPNP